jgi:hypothetical protein
MSKSTAEVLHMYFYFTKCICCYDLGINMNLVSAYFCSFRILIEKELCQIILLQVLKMSFNHTFPQYYFSCFLR